jgi:NAD(P)-dependent dehydrogenase (short-subunit alcohol dehydrogenase family)
LIIVFVPRLLTAKAMYRRWLSRKVPVLKGKVAIVTGAGAGIGRAIAERFAKEGAAVLLADKSEEAGQSAAKEIRRAGGKSLFSPCDVSREEDVRDMVETAARELGCPDILVNNAGVAGPVRQAVDVDLDEWKATLAVNIDSVFLCCKYVIPHMKRNRGGSIINIASVSGKRPLPYRSAYTTSKMGVIGFTRTLAAEVGQWGIRVNSVCPGSVTGERQKIVFQGIMKSTGKSYEEVKEMKAEAAALKCFVDPGDVAALVLFLAAEESAKITGQDINVSAGAVMY